MVKAECADMVELLIQRGANVNASLTDSTIGRCKNPGIILTNGEETPADWAEVNNQKEVLEILKKHGAKSSKVN